MEKRLGCDGSKPSRGLPCMRFEKSNYDVRTLLDRCLISEVQTTELAKQWSHLIPGKSGFPLRRVTVLPKQCDRQVY